MSISDAAKMRRPAIDDPGIHAVSASARRFLARSKERHALADTLDRGVGRARIPVGGFRSIVGYLASAQRPVRMGRSGHVQPLPRWIPRRLRPPSRRLVPAQTLIELDNPKRPMTLWLTPTWDAALPAPAHPAQPSGSPPWAVLGSNQRPWD